MVAKIIIPTKQVQDRKTETEKDIPGSRLFLGTKDNTVIAIIYPENQEEEIRDLKLYTQERRVYRFDDIPVEKLDKAFVYFGVKQGPIKLKPKRQVNSKSLEIDILYHEDVKEGEKRYHLYIFKGNQKEKAYSLSEKLSSERDIIKGIDKLIS